MSKKKRMIRKQSEIVSGRMGPQAPRKPLDPLVESLMQEMKSAGYESIKDYVKHLFKTWEDSPVIYELYQEFLISVQNNIEKYPDAGVWNEGDSFLDYLQVTKKSISVRLEELDWKKKTGLPSYEKLVSSKIINEMENVPKGIGESLSQEDREFYYMLLKRTYETIDKCIADPSKINKMIEDMTYRIKEAEEKLEKEKTKLLYNPGQIAEA